ncbi:MAG: ABC transporter permease [Solirubrobacteraceae bacterium]|nr:ABC transporter permease [Solirubrobacteraceae bacterium]
MSAPAPRPGSSWRRTRLITMRELRERMHQRAYRIGLVVGALLAAAAVAVPTLLGAGDDDPTLQRVPVAFADAGSPAAAKARGDALDAQLRAQGNPTVRVRLESAEAARELVSDGTKDFAVIVRGAASDPRVAVLARTGGDGDPAPVLAALEHLAVQARLDAVAPGEADKVLAPLAVGSQEIDSGGPSSAATAVVSVFGLIVYIAGILLMTSYATGIVSDRAGRVTERLLTAARPQEHLAGKLLGVGAAGLLQIGVWLLGGLVAAAVLSGSIGDTFEGVPISLIVYFPISIILTYLSYAALSTVLVLPVRKTEDVGGALGPATMIQIVTFILASGNLRPGAAVPGFVEVLSYVPFFSPLLMMIRIAAGGVPFWQVLVSALITLIASAILVRVAAPAYARYAIEAPGGKGLGAALATLRR